MTGELLKKDRIEEKSEIEYKKNVLFFENRVEREWLGTLEAASFLGVSENALRIMVYRGQIPVYKFGRRLRFRACDLRSLFTKKGA
jgi:excisionase family DNA binding protein